MIAHVVLFRLKPALSEETRDSLANSFSRAAREIPSIRRARIGSRVTLGRDYERLMAIDFPFAAILEFDDVPGIQAYLDHPAHEQLAQLFFACFEQTLIYDFEFWETDEGIRAIRNAT
jgi:hypothetical protein